MPDGKPIIAIATGDSAGIGPEISLKAALDPSRQGGCHPILVSDPEFCGGTPKRAAIEAFLPSSGSMMPIGRAPSMC